MFALYKSPAKKLAGLLLNYNKFILSAFDLILYIKNTKQVNRHSKLNPS